MKTNDFVKNLAHDLKPQPSQNFYLVAFTTWLAGTLALLAFSFWVLPMRRDLLERIQSILFDSGTLLCFGIFLAGAYVAYRSAIPGLLQKREVMVARVLILTLIVILISKFSLSTLKGELHGEANLYRGGCGPLIFILGAIETAVALVVARRGASTNPMRTGLWVALSAGGLGLFVMQFICEHETFVHLLLWHAIPVGILIGVGAVVGKRLLRW